MDELAVQNNFEQWFVWYTKHIYEKHHCFNSMWLNSYRTSEFSVVLFCYIRSTSVCIIEEHLKYILTFFQRYFNVVSTLKLDVVSTLKFDVISITKSTCFNVVSTLKVVVDKRWNNVGVLAGCINLYALPDFQINADSLSANYYARFLFVLWLELVFRLTREIFTHLETSPLPVKGWKFWRMLGTYDHWA